MIQQWQETRIRPMFERHSWLGITLQLYKNTVINHHACMYAHVHVCMWVCVYIFAWKEQKCLYFKHFQVRYKSFQFHKGWLKTGIIQIFLFEAKWSWPPTSWHTHPQLDITQTLFRQCQNTHLRSQLKFNNHYQYFHTVPVKTCIHIMS
jgi:hypothetical protein